MPKRDAGRSMSLTSQESYSAVIIADMVAEVQTDHEDDQPGVRRNHSVRSDTRNGSSKVKDQTNLGYDGQLDSSPAAVVDVEMVESDLPKRNGTTDLSRGVVLTTTHLGQPDKLHPDSPKLGKAMESNNAHSVPDVRKGSKVPDEAAAMDFHSMSVPRKIAFGFSFLPSIMFVLCFAVILPCKEPVLEPCIREMWSKTLNNTEVTSDLFVSGDVFYTFTEPGKNGVASLDLASGDLVWNKKTLQSRAHDVRCANLETTDSEACLVMEELGQLHLYNASNGYQLWNRNFTVDGSGAPAATLMPDCNGDGVTEIAFAVWKNQIKFLMTSEISFTVGVTGCDSVPSRLTAWKRTNKTDLLFTCQQGNKEKLMKLPQSRWCLSNGRSSVPKEEILTLETRNAGVLTQSVLLPTDEGLVVWVEDDVILFEADGRQRWRNTSLPHSKENRFLLFGKFNAEDRQVALFSSAFRSDLKVTTISYDEGSKVWSYSDLNAGVSDVSLIHGKERDFALVSLLKMKAGLASDALDKISEVSTTIISLLAKEAIPSNESSMSTSSRMSEEISFLKFGDNFLQAVEERELSLEEGELFRSTLTVVQNDSKDKENIMVFVLRKPTENSSNMTSQLRRIDVANWDVSINKESQCSWKH